MIQGRNSGLGETSIKDSDACSDHTTVAVIIPTFNHARFLPDSIMSVLAQTRPADEIIVVDDGSADDPASVVAQFPKVQFIRQQNGGPSAARNTGLRNCCASHVVFLDADDRLLPMALEAGLMRILSRPDCGFVYGGFRVISKDGRPISPDRFTPIEGDSLHALLHSNLPIIPSTALFRRDCVLAVHGFDETLRRCEDYDLFLNIAQRYPVASHPEIVAEYRKHGQNVSDNHVEMLKAELAVRHRYEARIRPDALARAHFRDGRAGMINGRVAAMLGGAYGRWSTHHKIGAFARDLVQAARWAPLFTICFLFTVLGRRASKVLSRRIV
jgi:glycosyltransferase involved in cell wall biosynthesis